MSFSFFRQTICPNNQIRSFFKHESVGTLSLSLSSSASKFRKLSSITAYSSFSSLRNDAERRLQPIWTLPSTRLYQSAADNKDGGRKRWFFADWEEASPSFSKKASSSSYTTKMTQSTTMNVSSLPAEERIRRIVFLGTPEVAAITLRALYDASLESQQHKKGLKNEYEYAVIPFEIAAVVTQPSKPRSSKRSSKKPLPPSPVGQLALDLNLPLWTPTKASDPEFLQTLEACGVDLCITAAYGQYLPKRFLATPSLGTLNLHPSLLPKWRGAAPVQRSLQAGDNPVGVTVLYTVSKMDAGPIVAQQEHWCHADNDTASTLLPLLFQQGTQLMLKHLPRVWDGSLTMDTATQQNEEQATSAPLIQSNEAQLRPWQETARECHNKMRGFSLWPQTYLYIQIVPGDSMNGKIQATTTYKKSDTRGMYQIKENNSSSIDNKASDDDDDDEKPLVIKVKVTETRVASDPPAEKPSKRNCIVKMGPSKKRNGLYVTCHDGSVLELLTVQPAGRPKPFPARDLQNGYPDSTLMWIEQEDTDNENY